MADSNSQPSRCPCGFWGSAQTQGLCSKCYREHCDKNVEASGSKTGVQAEGKLSSASLSKSLAQVSNIKVESLVPSGAQESKDTAAPSHNSLEPQPKRLAVVTPETSQEGASSDGSTSMVSSKDTVSCSDREVESSPCLGVKDSTGEPVQHQPAQKNKKRCFKCNCKLELAIREIGRCKCDYVFCQLHRLPEQHNCMYNHKEKGREEARDKMVMPKKHLGTSLRRIDSDAH